MAEHNTITGGADTPDALFVDRQRTWSAFTTTTMVVAGIVVLILVGMAVFLL